MLLLALWRAPAVWAQQPPEQPTPVAAAEPGQAMTEDEILLQGQLSQAETKFSSGMAPESILDTRRLITMAQQFAAQRPLTAKEQEILVKAFLLRAQAYFNIGQSDPAQEDLREALKLDASIELNPEEVSSKLIDLLDAMKKEELGTLDLDSEPTSAEVLLDGRRIGLTPLLPPAAVYKGLHELQVTLPGYDVYTEKITILPDQQLQRNVVLTRNSGEIVLYTQPSGAKIYLDDQFMGTSSGSPPTEEREQFGPEYDFSQLSGPLTIPLVKPGVHVLKIEKPCFETRTENVSIDTETRRFTPFKLDSSRATLSVDSPVDGAKVYLGEEFLGGTPVEQDGACTGTYSLRVEKPGVGRWFQEVVLTKDQRTEIVAQFRPTLAYLGVAQGKDVNLAESVSKKIGDSLREAKGVNLRFPDKAKIAEALAAANVSSLEDLASLNIPQDRREIVANQAQAIAKKLDVDLLFFGSFPEQRLQTTINLFLYLGGHGYADTIPVEFQNPTEIKRLSTGFDYQPVLSRSWTGMLTVDLLNAKGLGVMQVAAGSPAEKAGIHAGDLLLSAKGEPLSANRAFKALVEKTSPGQALQLQAQAGGNPRSYEITVGKTPIEIPRNNPDLLYNKILGDLDLLAGQAGNDFDKNFAQLNKAIAFMHFKNWQSAIDTLGKLHFETANGIGTGTVYYYLGEALGALEYKNEAMENYKKAMTFEHATVKTNDGDPVAKLAAKRLQELQ